MDYGMGASGLASGSNRRPVARFARFPFVQDLCSSGICCCLPGLILGRDPAEPPEITYCVVDGAGTLNLQAVAPALPMPDEEEIDKRFAELVVSLETRAKLVFLSLP